MKPTFQSVVPEHWIRARELRRQGTEAEKALWKKLRNRQLGVRFRRQHPIGPYIVDFYCRDAHLVIELDGDVHADPDAVIYDRHRDDYLQSLGFHIQRYPNAAVQTDPDAVMREISQLVQNAVSSNSGNAEF
jgi:very-short-patch-repair endonuclease